MNTVGRFFCHWLLAIVVIVGASALGVGVAWLGRELHCLALISVCLLFIMTAAWAWVTLES
jgi:hypothetical protein